MTATNPILFGRDPTCGIVSVAADRTGLAHVWRREADAVTVDEHRFLNWFLVRRRQFLADLPFTQLSVDDLVDGYVPLETELGLVRLRGDLPFRYLVLTERLQEVEQFILGIHNKSTGDHVRRLGQLRDEVYWRAPVEQYLILTGRTYFKQMAYSQLRRLQFDLETTGLDPAQDQIFMVSVSDSTGFRACLDTSEMSERELLEAFVALVCERDPDVLENHSIFQFDIPFLIQRAAALGVRLAIGRDGGTFIRSNDYVRVAGRKQPFVRYRLVGREVVDTLHAVRQHGAVTRDMRYYGLKEAARYFGFARIDREYVDGPEIWSTYQNDPERIRRYGADDVAEVDGLSKLLLASSFGLASMVPRPYERIATSGLGYELLEPLLVRAYLADGHSLPARQPGQGGASAVSVAPSRLYTTGVVSNVIRIDVSSLAPSVMLNHSIAPASDKQGAFLRALEGLVDARERLAEPSDGVSANGRSDREGLLGSAVRQLLACFYATLASNGSAFGDPQAASCVVNLTQETLDRLVAECECRGLTAIDAGVDYVLAATPEHWAEEDERRVLADVERVMGQSLRLAYDARFRAAYSYAEGNHVLVDPNGRVRLVGGAFRSRKYERWTERFLVESVTRLIAGDALGVREVYHDYLARLRSRQVPVEDLCLTAMLSRSSEQYRETGDRDELCEMLLRAGWHEWQAGQRVRFYRAQGRGRRLVEEYADDYDVEYYAGKLRNVGLRRLSKALEDEHLRVLLSEQPSLFEPDWAIMRPLATRHSQLSP